MRSRPMTAPAPTEFTAAFSQPAILTLRIPSRKVRGIGAPIAGKAINRVTDVETLIQARRLLRKSQFIG